jgi:hypothetical protein
MILSFVPPSHPNWGLASLRSGSIGMGATLDNSDEVLESRPPAPASEGRHRKHSPILATAGHDLPLTALKDLPRGGHWRSAVS